VKRTPIVLAGTVVGLTTVLGFHTSPAKISIGIVSAGSTSGSTTPSSTASATAPSSTAPATSAAPTTSSPPPTTTTATTAANSSPTTTVKRTTTTRVTPTTTTTVAPTTTSASGTRSATGPLVNYYFGTLSVSVTATGSKITAVAIASLSDGGNYRSQSIDQQSIPMLIQEAMSAQSANIQGISGASYTSAGFAQSLQGALKSLGI
jgi:uncharacterized protein with FMN-binding domain